MIIRTVEEVECPSCKGTGKLYINDLETGKISQTKRTCYFCNGAKKIKHIMDIDEDFLEYVGRPS